MQRPPRRNLPPDSEQWGRWTEERLFDLEQRQTQLSQTSTNNNSGLGGSLQQLSAQVSTLTGVVQTLTNQQGQLTSLVNALPVSSAASTTVSGWAATDNGNVATVNIPWVAGKTQCDVVANVQGFYVANTGVPNSDLPAFRIGIQGFFQPAVPKIPDNMDTYWFVGSFSRRVTTVGDFTVQLNTQTGSILSPAYPENNAYLGALAIFS